jgi:hypothetical protein
MHEKIQISKDAFSSGQVSSKLWLCSELENVQFDKPPIIWIYGGWHAMTAMLLLARQNMPVHYIRSFDVDPDCEAIADTLMENWIWQDWKFKAFTKDCNDLVLDNGEYGAPPDIVINTSTEHFHSRAWYDNLPSGTLLALQSNNMPHEDHHECHADIDSFSSAYDLNPLLYEGQLDFKYPSWGFSRYMIIGRKR